MPDYTINNSGTITFTNADGSSVQMDGRSVRINNSGEMYLDDGTPRRNIFGVDIERARSQEPIRQYIKSYNYIPEQFIFHKICNEEELYLGVELEIDSGGENEENAKYIYNLMNCNKENVYCKHDGSLDNGFEIVTHPCTIEYHKQLKYEKLFKELIQLGYRSHDVQTCGLHVHINRDYFGQTKLEQDLNISKLLYLYEKYWDKVELVARRKSNRYAKRFLLEEDETPLDLYAKSKESNKYGAINLQHKNTVEIRIFKGTLKLDTYLNTLEFVKVVANISKESDIYSIQFVTWDKIKSRFSDELTQYITDREEAVKKEERDKVDGMMNNRMATDIYPSLGISAPYLYCPDEIRGSFITSNSSYESERSEIQRMAYEELVRSSRQMVSIDVPSFTFSNAHNQRTERSEIELIQIKINELKTKVRRSRNGLEITNLNRQISDLENELRRLRRNI